MVNILKLLFGGNQASVDKGLYLYVQPKRCKEILRIRVNLANDLSKTDDDKGYFVRKVAHAARCPFPVEIRLTFDKNRNIIEREIDNGTFMTFADYDACYAEQDTDIV